ncbi:VOC family protein [uncultured Pseudomonas sp.]|uniref:VOC family protein n=1 Tax=uncultured Pseudomonas sp. TaxID=114707 RepID=UPI00259139E7|nr:VOC family protein [uncultured Pseudomonas sp.]
MKIMLTRILVDDQAKALAFYHYVLGFEPKQDLAMGQHRWLTLTSPNDPNGVQLQLEPEVHPAAKAYKAALKEDGIPTAIFAVRDIQGEYARLSAAGVKFHQAPAEVDNVLTAIFDDTCGNLIQITQLH